MPVEWFNCFIYVTEPEFISRDYWWNQRWYRRHSLLNFPRSVLAQAVRVFMTRQTLVQPDRKPSERTEGDNDE